MRQIINFNENWSFTKQTFETLPSIIEDGVFESVTIPHCWNAIDGQDGGNDYHRGTCVYAKKLLKADLPVADEYYLEINGANSSASVYVNGELIEEDYVFMDGYDFTPSGSWVVNEGEVFVMGDHRNNSTDSRTIGTVRIDSIIGKALFRFYPKEKFGKIE